LQYGNIGKELPVTFPDFNGTVIYDKNEDRHNVFGVYKKKSKTVLEITEVPYGFDREGYIKVLDKLEDDGDIVSYEDLCDKTGFKFEVKLKQNTSANWNDAKIVQKFKLSKPLSENLTVIDYEGKLREYKDARELVKDFCKYRLGILQERIDLRKKDANELARWLKVKMQFIEAVLDDKIVFKNKKKKEVGDQILKTTDANGSDDIDRLLRINIMSLTQEMVNELEKEIKAALKEVKYWESTNPNKQFELDLEEIE